ncbi:ATP-dependent acyl-CoA ligase [Ottowia sp.]|uniref:ATP-dependent acyl-CoA ligase n=1 Tax=Ottowia sp. TaxID=1898956 RepID=UPI002C86EFDC|nr:ATP-dependent acyl-CoA ligase [Ottowia sp.]HOB65663.1 ATP-dependent acyl-CoA ligase [Ottowia sp.]HPZ57440.1 ATP-dependent acyl-CoA ligase [Ottowia sp.]HQD46941.1 ATP-dependent acyl-CoA ligase [Ottowia sp.]
MSTLPPLSQLFAPPDRNVPTMLARQAAQYGDRPLLVFGEVRWSYAEARQMAAAYGGALRRAGIAAGDRVALLCSNRPEFMQALLGCAWIGAVAVPINVAARGPQLRHILGNSGARLLVTEGEGLAAVGQLQSDPLPLEQVWLVGGVPAENGVTATLTIHRFPEHPDAAVDPVSVLPGDTLAILYTSGTTGLSKGVCCPHAQYFWWGVHSAHLLGIGEGEILHTTLPLFHTNALNAFFQALLTGSTLVVEKRFSASAFWDALARHQATVTYVLGAMVPILLAREPGPSDRAHRVRVALAPGVPPQFHDEFTQRFGMQLLEGYGSTETNFVIGATLDEQRAGTMGRVRAGFEARVVDEQDNEVPPGEAGELVLRADEPFSFATGYFGMPDKTVEAWRNLWFHTGDRVIRDETGYFRFVDRLKDAIRRRGENISSYEVEQVLMSHPCIEVAAVYPVRSELAEDEVMAAIVVRKGDRLDEIDLMKFCEPRMAYFAVPRYVEFVQQLPATENGKVQKFKLRERGVTAATWDREAAGYKLAR